MHVSVKRVFLKVRSIIQERSGVPFDEASTTSVSENN